MTGDQGEQAELTLKGMSLRHCRHLRSQNWSLNRVSIRETRRKMNCGPSSLTLTASLAHGPEHAKNSRVMLLMETPAGDRTQRTPHHPNCFLQGPGLFVNWQKKRSRIPVAIESRLVRVANFSLMVLRFGGDSPFSSSLFLLCARFMIRKIEGVILVNVVILFVIYTSVCEM